MCHTLYGSIPNSHFSDWPFTSFAIMWSTVVPSHRVLPYATCINGTRGDLHDPYHTSGAGTNRYLHLWARNTKNTYIYTSSWTSAQHPARQRHTPGSMWSRANVVNQVSTPTPWSVRKRGVSICRIVMPHTLIGTPRGHYPCHDATIKSPHSLHLNFTS